VTFGGGDQPQTEAAAPHDLLAALGRGPDRVLGGRVRGWGTGDGVPHVAGGDPSGTRVGESELEAAAVVSAA
jgi:hypothetical protein